MCPDQKINVFGVTLFRIRSLISFGDIKSGEFGGYIHAKEYLLAAEIARSRIDLTSNE